MTKKLDVFNPPDLNLYTISDVAASLHVSRKSVSKWIKKSQIMHPLSPPVTLHMNRPINQRLHTLPRWKRN